MPEGGTQTPIPASFIDRITGAARYLISGVAPNTWFGPNQPLQPIAPQTSGRVWDYAPGFNINTRPRNTAKISFEQLRWLATSWGILATIIQSRQDQLCGADWEIGLRENSALKLDGPEVRKARDFMEEPAQGMTFQQWLRAISYDLLVLDAVALYKWRNKGGGMYAWQPLDAASIALLIDDKGQIPLAPDPAFQQILKGVPAVDYTQEELTYLVENVRTHTIYGYSRVEQIITTVNIALRREVYNLTYFSEGNIPPGIASLPKEWTPEQIAAFQKYWDWQLTTQESRQKMRFVPGETKYQNIIESPMKDEFDEWLTRIACYAFSVSPQPFTKMMNRATSETAADTAEQEGLRPLKRHLKTAITKLLREEFHPDIMFQWTEADETDQKAAAETAKTYVGGAIMTIDEQRAKLGLPLMGGMASRLQLATGGGMVMVQTELDDQGKPVPGPEEADPYKAAPVDETEPGKSGEGATGGKTNTDEDDDAGVAEKGTLGKSQASRGFMLSANAALAVAVLTPQVSGALGNLGAAVARQLLLGAMFKADTPEDEQAAALVAGLNLDDMAAVGALVELQIGAVLEGAAKQTIYDTFAANATEGMFMQVNTRAAGFAEMRAAELVTEITETTRNELRRLITNQLKEGASIVEIASSIASTQPFSAARASLIAETEVGNAFGAGQLIGLRSAKATGVKVLKEWVDNELSACPICAANAKQGPIALHKRFLSGDLAPLAHPRCKCTMVGVIPDDE